MKSQPPKHRKVAAKSLDFSGQIWYRENFPPKFLAMKCSEFTLDSGFVTFSNLIFFWEGKDLKEGRWMEDTSKQITIYNSIQSVASYSFLSRRDPRSPGSGHTEIIIVQCRGLA